MTDPMTPERLAEIREHLARTRDLNVCVDDWHLTLAGDADNLLAEVERLRAEMEETRDTIADPATGYITRLAKTEAERDAARAEVEQWRATFGETALRDARNILAERDQLRRTVAGWRDSYERLSRQALRLRFAWQSARRGRKQARAELADLAAQNAKTEDNFRDFAEDALAVQRERDRLARERDGLARADKAGQRWASGRIDALEEKVHRVRQVHAPQCGGGCAGVWCECGPDDLVCAECETPAPCATIRALDGTGAGQ